MPRPRPEELWDEVVRMRDLGFSHRQIAAQLHISNSHVCRILHTHQGRGRVPDVGRR